MYHIDWQQFGPILGGVLVVAAAVLDRIKARERSEAEKRIIRERADFQRLESKAIDVLEGMVVQARAERDQMRGDCDKTTICLMDVVKLLLWSASVNKPDHCEDIGLTILGILNKRDLPDRERLVTDMTATLYDVGWAVRELEKVENENQVRED